jgi:GATA-binding protein
MATLPPTPTPNLGANPSTQPICQNCQTSTTPLWRRDEMGSVLCNACGLFLKLHGRPRPISLKTDVIKSRNRVKTMRPDMQMKKKVSSRADPLSHRNLSHSDLFLQQSLPATSADQNGMHLQVHDSATATALAAVRRSSQHKANGHGDDTNSPVSRTGTPNMYDPHLPVFQGMDAHQFTSPALPQYSMSGGSPGHPASPTNGEPHGDPPQTLEQLIAANATLKTRVSELDLINELYRGRLSQLEQEQQNADNCRHQEEQAMKAEANERAMREDAQRRHEETQRQLEDCHRRENSLKRRLDDLEQELKEANEKIEKLEESEADRPSKKPRLDEAKDEADAVVSTPQSTT